MGQPKILLVLGLSFLKQFQNNGKRLLMKEKLTFYPNLYIGESISGDNLDKLKKKLQTKPMSCNFYVITISKNPHNQLEFYKANQLVQGYYRKYPPYIIGFASDRLEAMQVVEKIVQECINKRGDCALKEYLLC